MTDLERQIEENRLKAMNELNHIISYAEAEIVRCRKIPLLDDDEHADLVRGYADRIEEIRMDMQDLRKIGGRE